MKVLHSYYSLYLILLLSFLSTGLYAFNSVPDSSYYDIAKQLIKDKNLQQAEQYIQKGLQSVTKKEERYELQYLRGVITYKQKDWKATFQLLQTLDYNLQSCNTRDCQRLKSLVPFRLCVASSYLGKEKKMLYYHQKSKKYDHQSFSKQFMLLEKILAFYEKREDSKAIKYAFELLQLSQKGYIKSVSSFNKKAKLKYLASMASYIDRIAYICEIHEDLDAAQSCFESSKKILGLLPNLDSKSTNITEYNIAYINIKLNRYQEAEQQVREIELNNNKLEMPDLEIKAGCWAMKGHIMMGRKDYDKARTFYQEALNIAKVVYAENLSHLSHFYAYLGEANYASKHFENAVQNYINAVQLNLNQGEKTSIEHQLELAKAYAQIPTKKENAKRIFNSILKRIDKESSVFAQLTRGEVYYEMALISEDKQQKLKNHQIANRIFQNCKQSSEGEILNIIAWAKIMENEASFIQKIELAQKVNLRDSSQFIPTKLPSVKQVIYPLSLIDSYVILGDYYHTINKEKALKYYHLAAELGRNLKPFYRYEGGQSALTKKLLPIQGNVVRLATNLYKKTHKEEYFSIAFHAAENSKSVVLLDALNDYKAIGKASIPDSLFRKGQRLLGQIAYLQDWIDDIQQNDYEEKLEQQNKKLAGLLSEHQNHVLFLEREYPNYYHLKYKNSSTNIPSIQKQLQNNQLIIEYQFVKDSLYIFGISNHAQKIVTNSIEVELINQKIRDLHQFLPQQKQEAHDILEDLYEVLLAEIMDYFPHCDKITIIPDGILNHLPFDILKNEGRYVIMDKSIRYNYSTQTFIQPQIPSLDTKKLLGIVPKYNGTTSTPLPYALQEIKGIQEHFIGTLLLGSDAFLNKINQELPKHSITHIAGHTSINNTYPLRSCLLFSEHEDSTQSKLYAHEIYNMQLHQDMITLSACNAGVGEIQAGEGSMSLARGFAYAGCPTTVSTLWEMTDKPTTDIMIHFYHHLKQGLTKSDALRKAKLDFMANTGPKVASPFFWGGIVIMGSDSPIAPCSYSSNQNLIFFLYVILFAIIGIGVILFTKHRKRIRHGA